MDKSKFKNKEVEQLKNQLARALADYDNLRKRTEAEKSIWTKFAKQEILVKLLPAVDALESAQNHLKDKGLELALGEIKNVFSDEGIVEIDAKEEFDPNLHEAIEIVPGGKKNTIAQVLIKGYKFNDGEVIRHAKVKVYK